MLTRQHFEAIADALASVRPPAVASAGPLTAEERAAAESWLDAVNSLADMCAHSNDRFQRSRFIGRCNRSP